MQPSPLQPPHAPPQTFDVPIKTEERARPIPALPQQPPRVQRYKDKFQALRERYDNVVASHTDFAHKVQLATEKEQRLQDEINMLLDAALATAPQSHLQSVSTPVPAMTTTTTTTPTPTPVHAQLSPLEPHAVPASIAPAPAAPAHMNGHSSSVPPPHAHAHPHTHLHGHGYVANHAPPGAAPVPGSTTERATDQPLL